MRGLLVSGIGHDAFISISTKPATKSREQNRLESSMRRRPSVVSKVLPDEGFCTFSTMLFHPWRSGLCIFGSKGTIILYQTVNRRRSYMR